MKSKAIITILCTFLIACQSEDKCLILKRDFTNNIEQLIRLDNELAGNLIQADWLNEDEKQLEISGVKTTNTILQSSLNKISKIDNTELTKQCSTNELSKLNKKIENMKIFVTDKIKNIEKHNSYFEELLTSKSCNNGECLEKTLKSYNYNLENIQKNFTK